MFEQQLLPDPAARLMSEEPKTVERKANDWLDEIGDAWERAHHLHDPLANASSAATAIQEAYSRVWAEIKRPQYDKTVLRRELRDLAAECLRTLIDLGLEAEKERSEQR